MNKINFNNRFIKNLPEDSELENERRQVFQACYSKVNPIKTAQPKLITYSLETKIFKSF